MIARRRLSIHYRRIRTRIERRVACFRQAGRGDPQRLFTEFAFCLLTPQSSARACWRAALSLRRSGALFHAGPRQLSDTLRTVRFRHTKARAIVAARRRWNGPDGVLRRIRETADDVQLRDWLATHIHGMGMKEASHFVRNIGRGRDLAILDRHILRGLVALGVLPAVPRTLTPHRYRKIEARMRSFASKRRIPMEHLDLLLWHLSTGDLFK